MDIRQKSLVLITVDCLRAGHCGFHGYSRPTTPFLDSLASESFIVPNAVVAGTPTYYSLPAILASRMPLALGRDVVGLAPGESTLATALRDQGYATAAFSAANPYISASFGYDHGFDVFSDFLNTELDAQRNEAGERSARETRSSSTRTELNQSLKQTARSLGLGSLYDELYFQYCLRMASPAAGSLDSLRKFPTAEVIVDCALSWLASVKSQPFFLWLHLMDPHSPYYPAEAAYRELMANEISAERARYLNEFWNRSDLSPERLATAKDDIIALYDSGIRWADTQVARFVGQLQTSDIWDDCVLALTADHGEEFLEHGHRYHAPVNLHSEITHVPLMIRVPGSPPRSVSSHPFSHLHLAPTLLDIAHVSPPPSFQGKSLWRHLHQGTSWDAPAITECVYGCTNPLRAESRLAEKMVSVQSTRHKLISRSNPDLAEELYDLASDPGEENALDPVTQKQARTRLLMLTREHIASNFSDSRADLRLKARLRDLRVQLHAGAQ